MMWSGAIQKQYYAVPTNLLIVDKDQQSYYYYYCDPSPLLSILGCTLLLIVVMATLSLSLSHTHKLACHTLQSHLYSTRSMAGETYIGEPIIRREKSGRFLKEYRISESGHSTTD